MLAVLFGNKKSNNKLIFVVCHVFQKTEKKNSRSVDRDMISRFQFCFLIKLEEEEEKTKKTFQQLLITVFLI